MNRILTAAALVAMAAFTAAPALAATAAKPAVKPAMTKVASKPAAKPATAAAKPVVVTFKTIDANHDGKISYEELKKYWPSLTKAQFAKFAGKTGSLNHAGLAAFAKSVAPAKTASK
jgi:hypothetical protein